MLAATHTPLKLPTTGKPLQGAALEQRATVKRATRCTAVQPLALQSTSHPDSSDNQQQSTVVSRRQLGGLAALVASTLVGSEQSALARTMSEYGSGDIAGGGDDYNPNIMAGPDFNALGEVKREQWNGKMASGCLLTEDGKECRMQQLGDVDDQAYPGGGGRQIGNKQRASQSSEYVDETTKLINDTREVQGLVSICC